MGSTIYRGQCEECGEERGWTYSHGYLTQWEPRREWDLETDPTRIMVCVDCGSEHPVEGAMSERESGRRPRLWGLGALALLLPVATALALLVPVVWDRRWSILAAAIVVEVVVVYSLLRSSGPFPTYPPRPCPRCGNLLREPESLGPGAVACPQCSELAYHVVREVWR